MIELASHDLLASGRHRLIYADPRDDSRLIKVLHPDVRQRWQGKLPWHRQRERLRQYKGYVRELREYVALHARGIDGPLPIARTLGLIETNLGLGLVVDKLIGPDGALAETALALVKREGLSPWIAAGLDAWIDNTIRHDVILGDLHLRNLVWGSVEGTDPRFVMVDGFGEKNFIPRCSMSRRFNAHHSRELFGRLLKQIERDGRPL